MGEEIKIRWEVDAADEKAGEDAKEAAKLVLRVFDLLPEEKKDEAGELVKQIFNRLGVRRVTVRQSSGS